MRHARRPAQTGSLQYQAARSFPQNVTGERTAAADVNRLKYTEEGGFMHVLSGCHQTDAHLCTRHMDVLQTELSSEMKLLKETVKAKRAVHTAQVFVSVPITASLSCFLLKP